MPLKHPVWEEKSLRQRSTADFLSSIIEHARLGRQISDMAQRGRGHSKAERSHDPSLAFASFQKFCGVFVHDGQDACLF
jgi:hypothetical protein